MPDDAVRGQSPRERVTFGANVERWFAGAGLGVVPVLFVGMLLSGALPPFDPAWNADQTVEALTTHHLRHGIGYVVLAMGWSLYAFWGAAVTASIWRMERDRRPPILTMAHGILVGGNVVYFQMIAMAWMVAGFRAGDISTEISQAFSDFGWFLVLGSFAPFSLQSVVIAIATIEDRRAHRVWDNSRPITYAAWAYAAAGLLSVAIHMVKSGPFAFNGILAFWVTVSTWAVWEILITRQMFVTIARDKRQKLAEIDQPALAP